MHSYRLAARLDDRLHHDRDRGFRVASPVQHARGSCLDHPSPNIGFFGRVKWWKERGINPIVHVEQPWRARRSEGLQQPSRARELINPGPS